MKRIPIRYKLTAVMAAMVTAVVVIICVLNSTLFEKYYIDNRIKMLEKAYNEVSDTYNDSHSDPAKIKSTMQRINALHNINIFIIDGNWKTVYSTQNNVNDSIRLLQDIIFSKDYTKTILVENDDYTIVRGYDKFTSLNYIEVYGNVTKGSQIIMHISIESIEENVRIFNRFVQLAGGIVLLISIVVVYFISAKITKPVKVLSNVARKMSEMNFDAKYTGHDHNEIGELGNCMNIMSDNLRDNIASLKTANLELKKDIELKTKNDEMRREFLSNVSHELKTPIALIQGYAEGLKEDVNDDEESRDFYCEVIIDESQKMNNLVKKLLTLNQIEYDNDNVEFEQFDLAEFARDIIRANQIRFTSGMIKLEENFSGPFLVWFDKASLEEVFTNYLSNAINHCDGEKVIRISIQKNGDKTRLCVFNTGNNIPEKDIEFIWDKFYKVDKARTREYGGNGIGLSIVKAIMDKFSGDYGVNNLCDGVEFWFEI